MTPSDYVVDGPDGDGLMWLKWTADEGEHSVCLGPQPEADARLQRILVDRALAADEL